VLKFKILGNKIRVQGRLLNFIDSIFVCLGVPAFCSEIYIICGLCYQKKIWHTKHKKKKIFVKIGQIQNWQYLPNISIAYYTLITAEIKQGQSKLKALN